MRIKLGDWQVTPTLNLLERGQQSIKIEPRAMDVLVYLARHPGQVVSVNELVAAVWQGAVVTDHSVYLAISQLRQVLDDGEESERHIETIRKRGYRLTVPVVPMERLPESPFTPSTPESNAGSGHSGRTSADEPRVASRRPRFAAWIGGAFAIALTGVAALAWLRDGSQSSMSEGSGPGGLPKVAVLPCENLSPDPDDAYFAAGIHEEILNRLAQLSGIRVIARRAVLPYAQARPTIRQIALELDATAVMECSVRYAGANVLVTAQLIDPATGTHLWSNTYGGDRSAVNELFAMQADIATNITKALSAELLPAEERRINRSRTTSMEAYVHILKLFEGYRRYEPPQVLFLHVDRAIAADPEFAFAYAARAALHMATASANSGLLPGTLDAELLDAERQRELAREDAVRALEIDPELGFAHSLLGAFSLFNGNSDDARTRLERAVELSPGDPLVLRNYALFQVTQNRLPEALELIERARQLDPSLADPMIYAIGGEFEVARDLARQDVDRNALSPRAHLALGVLDAMIFDDAEAAERELRLAEQLVRENPVFFHLTTNLLVVYAYGRLGLSADAHRVYDEVLAALPDERALTPAARLRAHLAFGEIDLAYDWATRMANSPLPGEYAAPLIFMRNTFNDPVLERPEFIELRRRLGYRD